MKRDAFSFLLGLILVISMASCSKDDDAMTIDSSLPKGALIVDRSGSLTAENGTPTAGTVELGMDEANTGFLRFANDFMTELATGTVSVYFSTSSVFTADPGNGNPDLLLVGAVQKNGEQFFRLNFNVPAILRM